MARKANEPAFTLTMGDSGTGKSTSIVTQLASPHIKNVFILGTEPRFMESINQALKDKGLESERDRLHYAHCYPMNPSWKDLDTLFTGITARTYKEVSNATYSRAGYDRILDFLELCSSFKCECCDKEWGPIDDFDEHQFLNIDSMTGLAKLAKDAAVGAKPVLHEGEWGVAMTSLDVLVSKLAHSCRCFVNMTAHLDREQDLISGGTHVTILTIGKKLSPKLVPYFSEIICTVRAKDKFFWSTVEPQYTLKARILPFRDDIEPDFAPIINAYFDQRDTRSE